MRFWLIPAALALFFLGSEALSAQSPDSVLELPRVALGGIPFDAKVSLPEDLELPARVPWSARVGPHSVGGGEAAAGEGPLVVEDIVLEAWGAQGLTVELDLGTVSRTASGTVQVIPGWLSLLPPLFAIGFALFFRQVVLALASGVWLGALLVNDLNPLTATVRMVDRYAIEALTDSGHATIIVFTLLLGGMISVVTRSGGGKGLAELVTAKATSSRRGQVVTWVLGLLIFFDDYANSLLVGSSMRPISDRLRISREKLAFLVDATAAPVASVAVISSWIGVEVGYIADQYQSLGLSAEPYMVFLETIPYRFYPLLMLWFGLLLALFRRDFGPMWRAEARASTRGELVAPGASPASEFSDEILPPSIQPRWENAVLPVIAVVITAGAGMWVTGVAGVEADGVPATVRNIFGHSDSLRSLLWASLVGGLAAIILAVGGRALSLGETLESWLNGLKSMVLACVILTLAWALGDICRDIHTAAYIVSGIGSWLPVALLPAVVFCVAALVSFATGTSWGTMAVLFPLVIPMTHEMAPGHEHLMLSAVASILAGSVWGDHCSPISDTTIMSSLASSCDHVDHVRTQLPYALAVGTVSLLFGDLATGLGLYPAWAGLLLGALALFLLVRFVGRKVPDAPLRASDGPGGADAAH